MSWAEEQSWFGLEDIAIESEEYQSEVKHLIVNCGIWTTKDNEKILISHMKTNHIENCIKKCKRDNWRLYALSILENELKNRNYDI